jgi:hypothetical protein
VNLLDMVGRVEQEVVEYQPPGPVAAEFHKSEAFVRGIKGPVGSGKSSTCVMEIIKHTLKQKPYMGVRRARWAVLRNTFPELKSTTIKTWEQWLPERVAPIKWDSPISSVLRTPNIGDGTGMELEVLFIPIDSPLDTGKLRSLELTGAWINEASEIDKAIFDMVTQRVGRYPAKKHGGPVHPCVILDTNPPDDDHWWYKFAVESPQENWAFFDQPGGLIRKEDGTFAPNPDAENIHNIPDGYQYYFKQLSGKTDDWIKVFLLGQYGTTNTGKPVYPEWREVTHMAKEPLKPIQGLPLLLGFDFGLTPACIIAQLTPRGQLMILRELIAEDMGIRQFAGDVVVPLLRNEFPTYKIVCDCDPAGMARVQTDEKTPIDELLEHGIPAEPAATNDFIIRREAVAYWMTRMADGFPGFLVDPSCHTLRRGFNGGYRYERVRVTGEIYKDRPKKDKHSHPHDALQYLAMRARADLNPVRALPVQKKSVAGWT